MKILRKGHSHKYNPLMPPKGQGNDKDTKVDISTKQTKEYELQQ